jgi:hypothetical protein
VTVAVAEATAALTTQVALLQVEVTDAAAADDADADDDDVSVDGVVAATPSSTSSSSAASASSPWSTKLAATADAWLTALPATLPHFGVGVDGGDNVGSANGGGGGGGVTAAAAAGSDPLRRCLQREVAAWSTLLSTVRGDLDAVVALLKGERAATNDVRGAVAALRRDRTPPRWQALSSSSSSSPSSALVSASVFIADAVKRLAEVSRLATIAASTAATSGGGGGGGSVLVDTPLWLGALRAPGAFVAACRQAVALRRGWPLESLRLRVFIVVDDVDGDDDGVVAAGVDIADSFVFTGVTLCGCGWGGNDNTLKVTRLASTPLAKLRFAWLRVASDANADNDDATAAADGVSADDGGVAAGSVSHIAVSLPVYADATRATALFNVTVAAPRGVDTAVWMQRGACFVVRGSQ